MIERKWLLALLAAYFVYLLVTIDPYYLDADQASHAMTSVFFNTLIKDWSLSPSFSPSGLYAYANAYYVRYPKFTFIYGLAYPVINALLLQVLPVSIYLMKLLTALISVINLVIVYLLLKQVFNEQVGFLGSLVTAGSLVYLNFSRAVMPDLLSILFFTIGLLFYFRNSWKFSALSGVFFALSILAKEIGLIFVSLLVLVSFRNFKRSIPMYLLLGITLMPYVLFLYLSGGWSVLLDYPKRQLWYGLNNSDPQWTSITGWLYFFGAIASSYSFIGVLFFVIGAYYVWRNKKDFSGAKMDLLILLLLSYFALSILNDKAPQRFLHVLPLISMVIVYGFSYVYESIKNRNVRLIGLFAFMLMLVIPFSQIVPRVNTPLKDVTIDLVISCPNCTILIASETGRVYSSSLMFEALTRDSDASLRFIRPTAFESLNAIELISQERVNRVVVIGSNDFINSDPEMESYRSEVNYIANKYPMVGYYKSDIVGEVRVYDTGITDFKSLPYCTFALAIDRGFCTDYSSPIDALHA